MTKKSKIKPKITEIEPGIYTIEGTGHSTGSLSYGELVHNISNPKFNKDTNEEWSTNVKKERAQ